MFCFTFNSLQIDFMVGSNGFQPCFQQLFVCGTCTTLHKLVKKGLHLFSSVERVHPLKSKATEYCTPSGTINIIMLHVCCMVIKGSIVSHSSHTRTTAHGNHSSVLCICRLRCSQQSLLENKFATPFLIPVEAAHPHSTWEKKQKTLRYLLPSQADCSPTLCKSLQLNSGRKTVESFSCKSRMKVTLSHIFRSGAGEKVLL